MRKKSLFWIFLVLIAVIIPYQNCAPGFESNFEANEALSDLGDGGSRVVPKPGEPIAITYQGVRPLTKVELETSLNEVLNQDTINSNQWDTNNRKPFDNNSELNIYDKQRVERAFLTADQLAQAILSNPQATNQLFPCATKNIKCVNDQLSRLMTIFFRGMGTNNDLSQYQAFLNEQAVSNSFEFAAKQLLTTLLLDPKFLYRTEEGRVQANKEYKLSDIEYLNKLSFFITGAGPSSDIVTKVKGGFFNNSQNVENYVNELLASNKFNNNMIRFHADWLGFYFHKGGDTFSKDAFKESQQLLEKVIFKDNSSWFNILTSKSTYINNNLARNYGLPEQSKDVWRWQDYGARGRSGLLSHASFLSIGIDGQETNPTKRGYHLQKTLFCGKVAPPPKDIDVDMKPPPVKNGRDCKIDRVVANTVDNPGCFVCHRFMDSLGFGLENYDYRGRFIAAEKDKPECDIDGQGQANTQDETGKIINLGDFSSPASLSEVLVTTGAIGSCLSQRLIEFDTGMTIAKNNPLIQKLSNYFDKTESLKDLVRYYVLLPEYRLRK